MSSAENDSQKISYSSVETQRKLRIEKMRKLQEKGHNPYTPYSKRDFTLNFVKFWFDFVHNFDLKTVIEDGNDMYTFDYFLHQVMFPQSLLEKMEYKVQMRHTFRQMGLDPDEEENPVEEEFEPELIDSARKLFPGNLLKITEEQKLALIREYLRYVGDEGEDIEDEEMSGDFEITFKPRQKVTLAGRIKSKRVSGKIAFATIEDEDCPDGFQFIFKKDNLPEAKNSKNKLTFIDFKELIDEGDYIQASGKLDYSQRGEPSLFVEKFEILTKALRPLPDKLDYENFEERYLHRVVDFKMNTRDKNDLSVREMMKLKSKYWLIWREEMLKEGFIEVETPVFKLNPSGAESKPFVTFYNELDQEVFMRMELELAQKKLIAGGFEKVFEIGRQFRNEGSSPQHLQEYTQIEWYGAYLDYNYAMRLTKKIYQRLAGEIIGGLIQKDYYGNTINWGEWCGEKEAKQNGWKLLDGWPQIPYYSAMRHFSDGKVDVENKSISELVKIARDSGIEAEENLGVATIMDKIWKKVRINVTNPIFLILPPVELEPLAKRHPEKPELTERFQVVAGGNELGKGFSELNDPLDQLERFAEQQKAREAGNEEAMAMDTDFVEALEYGTPPMAGFGTSERFFAFLLGKHIRECVTFPHVRPQNKENLATKSKTTMVAHCLILDTPKIPTWSKLNTVAHLSAAFAAREGKKLIHIEETTTKDGEKIPTNIQHAIIIKKTAVRTDLLELKRIAEKNELTVTVFTEEMRDTSDDLKVKAKQEAKSSQEIRYLGILIFGEKKLVEKLTEGFEMTG